MEEYNSHIQQARREIHERVREERLQEIELAIAAALAQIDAPDEPLTADRAEQLRRRYDGALRDLQTDLVESTNLERQQAQDEIIEAHEAGLLAAAAALGISQTQRLEIAEWAPGIRERVGSNINARRGLDDSVDRMINRRLQAVGSDIDEAINAAVSQSKSAAGTVSNIAAAVASDDLSGALEEVGAGSLVDEDSDISMQSASQLYRNVKRIVSHEVAAIADETGKTLTALNPAVDLVKWELSSRHASLESSPDACDVLARNDPYGYGPGLYHPKTVPSLPHPHCECSQSAVMKEPSDWFSGGRDVPSKPSIEEDSVRGLMKEIEGERSITDAHVRSQTQMLDRVMSAVHENPRGF